VTRASATAMLTKQTIVERQLGQSVRLLWKAALERARKRR
jgi:hypothetical protein